MREPRDLTLLVRTHSHKHSSCMDTPPRTRRPGDFFLDRYMPNATEQEREEAYENLRSLVSILIEIDDRIAREKRDCDSHDSDE
jgi:hypothetical protein